MMKIMAINSLIAVILTSAISTQAGATTVTLSPDTLWHTFDVDNTFSLSGNLEWIDAQNLTDYNNDFSALDFQINLTSDAYLTVVDGGFAGDVFTVYDNGNLLGSTSAATNNFPSSVSTNFDAALADNHYSKGIFHLTAGNHDITGLLSVSATDKFGNAFDATVGAVSLTSVPLPQTLGMFMTGFGLLGVFSRRRTK